MKKLHKVVTAATIMNLSLIWLLLRLHWSVEQ